MASKSDNRQGPQEANLAGVAAHMGAEPAAGDRPGRDGGRVLRVLALIAVAGGLAALTAAACVLSYSSIHHLALRAGVHGRLASIYPLIFDALLVVAGCSVLALRGAGLVSRVYSWLSMLVLLAALAAGGAAHAAAVTIPHKTAAVVAAIVPWVLVLIGFGLLLALLRYARLRRLGKRNGSQESGAGSGSEDAAAEAQDGAIPQRALIPGLAPSPQAIAAPQPGNAAAAPSASQVQDAAGKRAGGAGQAATGTVAADASSGGSGTEPPTVPGSAVPPRLATPADDRAAERPAAPAGSPSAAATTPATGTETGLRPGVRRADLQLRARIPKQPAPDQAGTHPPLPGWPAPFMPKLGLQGAGAGEQAGAPADTGPSPAGQPAGPGQQGATAQHGPAAQHDTAQHDATQHDTAHDDTAQHNAAHHDAAQQSGTHSPAALPKRVPGQQPVASGRQPAAAGPTSPRLPPDEAAVAEGAEGGRPAAGPTRPSTLNPAPTHGDDARGADGLPAFRRTRSTPTPPLGDEPLGEHPRDDQPLGDQPRDDQPRDDQPRADEERS